jgi:uncharacterized membrane protein
MNKKEFLKRLREALRGLPQSDVDERVSFYSEMIDDRIEEGFTEEEAVSGIGDVNDISAQIISETPLGKIVKEKARSGRSLRAWEIVLLVLGSPIWLSLLIAAAAVVLSAYIVLCSLIIALWAIEVAFVACALGGIVLGVCIAVFNKHGFAGVALVGMGIICAGLSIFMFFGCMAATKGIFWIIKKTVLGVKNLVVRKVG